MEFRLSMKTALLTLVLWMHALFAMSLAAPPNPPLGKVVKDWKTIRISLTDDGGDEAGPEWFILLQRLDGERVFLSTNSAPPVEFPALPVALAMISNANARKYVDRAQDFFHRAQSEVSERMRVQALPKAKRDAYWKEHNRGIDVQFMMMIEVLSRDKSYIYAHDFADEGATVKEFREFLEHPKIGLP
jgi:hypothetical protein